MVVETIPCPHCGKETSTAVPAGQSVKAINQDPRFGNMHCTCVHCKCTFGVTTR